ncbi:uncharacterized protein A1O5_00819 [Cladophialophora psammophila CBS 110553]|uniref:BTB domain-containing protein n=1 Tax=Cladophialophora psammophila CBS 110553 TaxID=1182543 RepID=W9XH86_9EURO|nr:uncharacterized protein A1O5_00819 [Cladophialophora psammophila CBS 110553]EXJ76311.1 hypothetical protein A1O5_00819 [Cladophialophora psammophila CBS 110553]
MFDPQGDILLVLNRSITASGVDRGFRKSPTKKLGDGADAQLETFTKQPDGTSAAGTSASHEYQEIEARVSSKHLTLASRVFRAMFDGNFQERIEPGLEKLTRIPLPKDDADAMLILLGIIHGLNRNVPREIGYTLFSEIVLLVDKYELHEVTCVWTDLWFDSQWPARDKSFPGLTDWIYICWVLRRISEYKDLTRTVIYNCTSRFEDNGLQIPPAIASEIESQRLSIIEDMLKYINNTIESYESGEQHCLRSPGCDALVLGDLIKKLKLKSLYPVPQAAALDISIAELFSRLGALELFSLCQMYLPEPRASFGSPTPPPDLPACGIGQGLKGETSRLGTGIKGLELLSSPR